MKFNIAEALEEIRDVLISGDLLCELKAVYMLNKLIDTEKLKDTK